MNLKQKCQSNHIKIEKIQITNKIINIRMKEGTSPQTL